MNDSAKIRFQLSIGIICILVLLYFLFGYISNILKIYNNYYHKYLHVNQINKTIKEDNNEYDRDLDLVNNNKNEIIKSINNIKNSHTNQFSKLKQYKEETNNEYRLNEKDITLDTNLYSEINSKVLSKKYDNYNYDSNYSIFKFIGDIFKPTTA